IAIMNDMHIGEGYNDFGTYGWNDADSGHAPNNEYIINNYNVVVHINQHNPEAEWGQISTFYIIFLTRNGFLNSITLWHGH
ncbi:MAG: hypothetical protein ABIL18_06605, partial [candidate division WOR-3 bacterium]